MRRQLWPHTLAAALPLPVAQLLLLVLPAASCMPRRGVRAVVPGVLSPEECAELTFVHRALSAAGYSPHLWTTKLSDVAYSQPALLLPLVRNIK